MRRWVKRILWGLLTLLVVGYLGACLWLRVHETELLFPRTLPYVPPLSSLGLNQQRVEFGEVDGTRLYAWIIPSLPSDSKEKWVLLFHGNASNVSLGMDFYDDLRAMGFNVMAPEYPGYLDSPGKPSQPIIEREAKAAYDYLRTARGVPPKSILIYGGSLGAAFAIDLASRVEAGALVEHAGFTSVVAMGRERFPFLPVELLIENRLESDRKIGAVRMPILLLHSTEDNLVPFTHAERLYELASSPKRLVRLRGPHGGPTTTKLPNPGFLSEIVTFLNAETALELRMPLRSIAPIIAATIDSEGLEPALARYRLLLAENPRRYSFKEPELDHLGYHLLENRKITEAIAVLRLNAEQFPQSSNVFDSLGDAYAAAGKDAEAVQSYRQSLALLPEETNPSREKLGQLQKPRAR